MGELLDAVRQRAALLLEVKDPALYPGIEEDVIAELAAAPGYLDAALRREALVAQSFDIESMRRFSALASDIPVGLLYGRRPTDAELIDASGYAAEVNINNRFADRAFVDRVHELGMRTSLYTVDGGGDMYRLADLGLDGLITDYPIVLLDLLAQRGSR
ncbi:hypothetical protein BH20ACT8_BH20ACT8_15090 [soil metagenome]